MEIAVSRLVKSHHPVSHDVADLRASQIYLPLRPCAQHGRALGTIWTSYTPPSHPPISPSPPPSLHALLLLQPGLDIFVMNFIFRAILDSQQN